MCSDIREFPIPAPEGPDRLDSHGGVKQIGHGVSEAGAPDLRDLQIRNVTQAVALGIVLGQRVVEQVLRGEFGKQGQLIGSGESRVVRHE